MANEFKVGGRAQIVRVDRKGWRSIYRGVIEWIDESPPEGEEAMVVLRLTHYRLEHAEHPERGRDLPAPTASEAFGVTELKRID